MKIIFCAFLSFLFFQIVKAQGPSAQFGKVSPEDLKVTPCSFDPDASAVCQLDIGENRSTIEYQSISINGKYKKRFQVLKSEGISRVADVKIRYYSKNGFEKIDGLSGIVYNLDQAGKVVTTKLNTKLVYDKKINSDWSELSFALPDVKVGSIVEYQYKTYKRNSISDIADWTFQSDLPVVFSQYDLLLPEFFDFSYIAHSRQKVDIHQLENNGATRFTMQNIPSLHEEPYMSSVKEYLQRVEFQLASITWPGEMTKSYRNTWEKLSQELMEAEWFGKQVRKNIHQLAPLNEKLKFVPDPAAKLKIIYEFVQTNMSWNGDYARGSYDGIKDAWNKKSGSIADINFLLLNLLKDNDIDAWPMLVSTRDNGAINTVYPMLTQFNAMYVYALANEKIYILNAADKYNPADMVPYDVQLTHGLIVRNNNPFLYLINDDQTKYEHKCDFTASVNAEGILEGVAKVKSSGYGANVRSKMYKNNELKTAYAKGDLAEFKIDSVKVLPRSEKDASIIQTFNFTGKLKSSAGYYFLPYNSFLGINENPFIAEKRQSAIDFGYLQAYKVTGFISVDSSFTIEELPKNIKMILPDTSVVLTRIIQKGDGFINFEIKLNFSRERYEVSDYQDLQLIYKKIFAILSESIALKKRS